MPGGKSDLILEFRAAFAVVKVTIPLPHEARGGSQLKSVQLQRRNNKMTFSLDYKKYTGEDRLYGEPILSAETDEISIKFSPKASANILGATPGETGGGLEIILKGPTLLSTDACITKWKELEAEDAAYRLQKATTTPN
jgi:hypothetical protein